MAPNVHILIPEICDYYRYTSFFWSEITPNSSQAIEVAQEALHGTRFDGWLEKVSSEDRSSHPHTRTPLPYPAKLQGSYS